MELLVFLLIAILPILLLFVLHKHRKNVQLKNLPPGPPGLPIIGNMHQLDTSSLHTSLWELSNKHGPLMSLRVGFVPTIVISSARVAKEVFKIHDLAFSGRPNLVGSKKLSYEGLDIAFAPYSDYWREMKKVCVVYLFNTKRSSSFHPIRKEETSRMIARISEDVASSKLTNLSDLVLLLMTNIICRIAFGKRYEEEGKENKRFHKLIDGAAAMMGGFFFQDYYPYMGWLDVLRGMHKRLHQTCLDLDTFYQEIIDEHLDPQRPKSDLEDLVDILLGMKTDDQLFSTEMTLEHIKGVLMNVFFGATETSSATLVWALTMMMKNPRVLKKVQEEIRTNVGNKGFVEEDDIQKLPYLNAVMKETARLYPAGPLIPRETIQHCSIDGYDIAPQTQVYISAWAIGRDPEAWENPNEFYPERFLGKSIDFKGQNYELVPFGAGRRSCPGINLASATLGVALSNLLYSFDWKLPQGVKGEDIDMTTRPGGLAVNKKIPLCLQAKTYNWKTPA